MSALKLSPGELQNVQRLASLCETHAGHAARCKETGNTGAMLVHESIAQNYSHAVFALSRAATGLAEVSANDLIARSVDTPGLDLHLKVRAGFVAQGSSMKRWCREQGITPSNARDALIGRWNGPKGIELRKQLVKASGVELRA